MTQVNAEPQLLSVVRRVLAQHGFRLEEFQLDELVGASWLLAESESFVLGVVTGKTFDDLLVLEGYVSAALGQRLRDGDIGAKRWDSYVVLLTSAGKDQRGRPEVVRLQYNTRSLRRLVALGVAAHEDAVSGALATFLPLPEPPPGGLPSSFDELVTQLVINGISEDEAASLVATYRSTRGRDGA
jgi:hypothetical protein